MISVSVAGGWAAEQRGDCGHQQASVIYQKPSELDAACDALARIIEYFRRMGFDITPNISFRFVDHSSERFATHGYFDGPESRIVVYRTSNGSPWGLPWSSDMAASFLCHEVVHMALWQIVNGDRERLRGEWHEFIAYAIQLDFMESRLLSEILTTHAHVRPFDGLMQVNELTYHMDPEVFAVAAYRTYLVRGGMKFVRQLLSGEIIPPRLSYPLSNSPE